MESFPIYTIIITLYWECTRKLVKYNVNKADYNQKIKEENVCECVWMLGGVGLVHLND
jgi:hypothetical protein